MKPNSNSLFDESIDTTFDNAINSNNNSGYVEAIYTSSGIILLRATNDPSKDISTKELKRLMK